jgi:type II secretory pathway pseudopilin PulG
VLAIIGLMAGGGLLILTASTQTAQLNATVARMDTLNTALLNYRLG